MQDDRPPADGTMDAFRKHIRSAGGRYRLERLSRASLPLAWGLAVALLLLLLVALVSPVAACAWQIALSLLALTLVAALGVYLRKLDRHRLLVQMDAHGKMPDSVLTAGDWENAAPDPWRERQRIETLGFLSKINWTQAWPVHWSGKLGIPLAGSLAIVMVLVLVQHNWVEHSRAMQLALQQENAPVTAEQLKPLEQVFQDWEEAQKIAPSPEMEELLKEIKPMRDQMADGKMNEKELFLKLNEVQARVQAAKDKLEATSMEPSAQKLAEALKDLDGMSGLAAALQRKDFAAAREEAAKAQEKYDSGAAKMPEGDKAQMAANKMGEAAQKAANNPQAAAAMNQMQNGLAKKDGSQMSKGLEGLKSSLGQQAQKQSQSKSMSLQLAQLSQCKNGMGQCNNPGIKMGLPQLSLAKSLQPGKGAGTSTDPNREGPQTQLDANHQEMKITGTAGDGASETQTESTKDSHFEQTAGSVNSTQFAAYEKLSEQATQDENLPVADRQMIKRYFEDIRPQGNP